MADYVPTSSVALAIQEVTRQKRRLFLMSGAGSSDLTGKACSPYGFQWTYDTYALGHGTGGTIVKQGGNSWFFITANYAFGHALQRDTSDAVNAAGGRVLGSVKVPQNTHDFSSFLLQAKVSKAKVIGLANAGGDTVNSIRQASEFGIVAGGQKLAGLFVFITDVHSLGLKVAQGLTITSAWYWDRDDASRAFANRFIAKNPNGLPPTYTQAGVYSAVTHYLKAIKSAGTDDTDKLAAHMRALRVNDFMTKDGWIRQDGRIMRDMYLEEVKSPEELKYPFDYFKTSRNYPGRAGVSASHGRRLPTGKALIGAGARSTRNFYVNQTESRRVTADQQSRAPLSSLLFLVGQSSCQRPL